MLAFAVNVADDEADTEAVADADADDNPPPDIADTDKVESSSFSAIFKRFTSEDIAKEDGDDDDDDDDVGNKNGDSNEVRFSCFSDVGINISLTYNDVSQELWLALGIVSPLCLILPTFSIAK